MDKFVYNFPIRVLVYREDDEILAHAIEMDIVADGDTEEAAMSGLRQLIANQISFALQKGEEHLVWRRAPKECFDRWDAAQTKTFRAITADKPFKCNWDVKAEVIILGQKDIENIRKQPAYEIPVVMAGA